MNDDRLGPAAGEWLRDIDAPPIDPEAQVQQAMELIRVTPQVRRSWPFPLFRQKTRTLAPTDTTGYLPRPIPATNGHAPTTIGRNQSMFSPAKAIGAGALVFVIGATLLIARPFDQQAAIAPGASSGQQAAAPVEFTATWATGGQLEPGEIVVEDSVVHGTGRVNRPVVVSEATDPRLRGTLSAATNSINYNALGGPAIWHQAVRIENEDGAWQQVPALSITFPDGEEPATTVGVLVGERAYEGLIAVYQERVTEGLGTATLDLRGYIIEGELPPPPERYVER